MGADASQVTGAEVHGHMAVPAEDLEAWRIAVLREPSSDILPSQGLRFAVGSSSAVDVIEREKGGLGFPATGTAPSVGS